LVKLQWRAAASKATSSDIEGVRRLGFIHKAHAKPAGITFAPTVKGGKNHENLVQLLDASCAEHT
jgi:hypothetical protein